MTFYLEYRSASGYTEDMADGENESYGWFDDFQDYIDYWNECHKKINACP